MEIREAIIVLHQMDPSKDVTLVFGEARLTELDPNNKEVHLVSPAYYEQFNRAQQDWAGNRDEIPLYL